MNNEFFQESERQYYEEFNRNLKIGDENLINQTYYSYYSIIRNLDVFKRPYNLDRWKEVEKKYYEWKRKRE